MKKLSILMLSVLALPIHAQSILNTLNQHQSNLKPAESSSSGQGSSSSTPDVKPSSESISSSSTKCEENDQTSLPLAYINSLILQKDGALSIEHNPSEGSLEINAPNMITNCNSMIEWKLKKPEFKGQKAWAIEATIRKGDVCNVDGTCSYKVKQVHNNDPKESLNMNFKPTLKGFEECLQKSGVIVNGKVVPEAIAGEAISEKFTGLDYSGKLLFLSHGPSSPLVKAKYGKFEYQNGCDYYENVAATPRTLLTLSDAERARLDAQANQLRDCKVEEYGKLTTFINQYEEYASELGDVRNRLILEAVKKSADNLTKGKYTDDDLKVLQDFEKYIVNPKIEQAVALYEETLDLEGDALTAKKAELTALLAEISALQKAPYFTAEHVNKLMNDGKFDQAKTMNRFITILFNHQRLGTIENGTKITSGVAAQRSNLAINQWEEALKTEILKYEHRTGQKDTEQAKYVQEAASARARIQRRNALYTERIQTIYADMVPPNGHCYKYWVNTQKCITDTQDELMANVNKLQFDNNFDAQTAATADANAKEWGALSAQGRQYIAAQNGQTVPAETQPAVDTTLPPERQTQQTNPGNFFNFGQQQQGQGQQQYFNYQGAMQSYQQFQQQNAPWGSQQNFMNQQNNPYAPYMGGQQNFMGQQAYGYQPSSQYGQAGGLFNFNFGFGNQQQPYGQQYGYGQQQYGGFGQQQYGGQYGGYQQSPYGYNTQQQNASMWYRPYGQAYNQYSLYGR